jgi:Protein of unknown function (DUF3592)
MNLADAILLPFVLLIMSVIVFRDLRYMFRKRASENWPKTEATIESVTTVRRRLGLPVQGLLIHRAWFTYIYSVSGIQYTGFFVLITGNKKAGEGLQQALAGKRVVIRYDTCNPGISFLSDTQLMGKPVHQDPRWTYYTVTGNQPRLSS